jgi:hypothetical protein
MCMLNIRGNEAPERRSNYMNIMIFEIVSTLLLHEWIINQAYKFFIIIDLEKT